MSAQRFYLGIYATSPTMKKWDRPLEERYFQQIKETVPKENMAGLELPFFGDELHPHDEDFLSKNIDPDWNHVMTCITGNMGLLEKNKQFGLASDDDAGRREAIAFHEKARQAVERLNNHLGRQAVKAVQFVASPTVPKEGVNASKRSLQSSLEEMSSWDWFGAKLNLEHCDTKNSDFPAAKGFLKIEDELAALQAVKGNKTPLGMTINWGRSCIEARSVDGPVQHILAAKFSGVLSGLMFSGATDQECDYGVFQDTHMPFAKAEGCEYYEEKSLLTEAEIKRCLEKAEWQKLDYLGAKVLAMPIIEASLERRVGLNRDSVRMLDRLTRS